jgi:hypothetical protein
VHKTYAYEVVENNECNFTIIETGYESKEIGNSMDAEKRKLIQQLEEIGEVTILKKVENPIDAFSYYFSKLDINGLENVLSNQNNYDSAIKVEYLNLIEKEFINLKNNGIQSLKVVLGVCDGC